MVQAEEEENSFLNYRCFVSLWRHPQGLLVRQYKHLPAEIVTSYKRGPDGKEECEWKIWVEQCCRMTIQTLWNCKITLDFQGNLSQYVEQVCVKA